MVKDGFVRELYLRSIPSVDLNLLAEGTIVDCRDYKIKAEEYEKLLEEYCEDDEDRAEVFFFMLNKGPDLID